MAMQAGGLNRAARARHLGRSSRVARVMRPGQLMQARVIRLGQQVHPGHSSREAVVARAIQVGRSRSRAVVRGHSHSRLVGGPSRSRTAAMAGRSRSRRSRLIVGRATPQQHCCRGPGRSRSRTATGRATRPGRSRSRAATGRAIRPGRSHSRAAVETGRSKAAPRPPLQAGHNHSRAAGSDW